MIKRNFRSCKVFLLNFDTNFKKIPLSFFVGGNRNFIFVVITPMCNIYFWTLSPDDNLLIYSVDNLQITLHGLLNKIKYGFNSLPERFSPTKQLLPCTAHS